MEHQTLGRRFVCPNGPATQREFILDWRISSWCDSSSRFRIEVSLILFLQGSRISLYCWTQLYVHRYINHQIFFDQLSMQMIITSRSMTSSIHLLTWVSKTEICTASNSAPPRNLIFADIFKLRPFKFLAVYNQSGCLAW